MYSGYTSLIKRYINPFIGEVKLTQINALLMSRFYEQLRHVPSSENKYRPNQTGNLSANTVFEIHQLLRSVFNQAVIWGYFSESPVKHIRIKKPQRSPINILTPDQIMVLLNRAAQSDDDFMPVIIQLAFMASVRKGELVALRWEDIDFDNCSIQINKEVSRVSKDALDALASRGIHHVFPSRNQNAKTRLVLKAPKTESSVRVVYIPPTLVNSLRDLHRSQLSNAKEISPSQETFGFVFAKEDGALLQGDDISDRFYALLEECGLPRVVFHSLRHSSTT